MKALLISLFALVLLGCATVTDPWDDHIGSYTYSQAVIDKGPADRIDKLDNGKVSVVSWTQGGSLLTLVFNEKGILVRAYGSDEAYRAGPIGEEKK